MKSMKQTRILILSAAVVMGQFLSASAFAANAFSDVPAGHWAYESIAKLTAAGVIEGYGDDSFRGDRLMSRYEMAQITAKAMAKGANIDRLAAEFAKELDALGVRLASLEKKTDNVTVTGEAYFFYEKANRNVTEHEKSFENALRNRVYLTGNINDNWKYTGRIENWQWFHDYAGNEETSFNIAKAEGRLGGLNVMAGRDDYEFADGYIYDGEYDALKVSYGDKYYISGAFGKLTELNDSETAPAEGDKFAKTFWTAEIGTKMDGFINGKLGYLNTKLDTDGKAAYNGKGSLGIWYAGLVFNLTDDLALTTMYLKGNRDKLVGGQKINDNGFVGGLSYKGAEEAKPGTWGLEATYFRQGRSTYLLHTIDGYTDFKSGFKGWSVGGELTVAKNMVLGVFYYDTRPMKPEIDGNNARTKIFWTDFTVTF